MKILALEGYYGGSHRAFLDGWARGSRHAWELMTLPPHKWKWRMRHAAVTFTQQVAERVSAGANWDAVFCSDMVNVAEFLGLAPEAVRKLPVVVYFHENQLTYPVRFESERDYQFAVTNMTSALAARSVWFNSGFARDEFLDALGRFLRKMPDYQGLEAVERIREKSRVVYPGVEISARRRPREDGPMRILWAARWEHDKRPEDFFEALKALKARGVAFRLSVVGEQFRDGPEVFEWAREYFASEIDRWGYQDSREEYEQALAEADVFVSTAGHEFFGISCVEACLAGAWPVLPERLAYREILGLGKSEGAQEFFYDGTVKELVHKLEDLAKRTETGQLWDNDPNRAIRIVEHLEWPNHTPTLDTELEHVASGA